MNDKDKKIIESRIDGIVSVNTLSFEHDEGWDHQIMINADGICFHQDFILGKEYAEECAERLRNCLKNELLKGF